MTYFRESESQRVVVESLERSTSLVSSAFGLSPLVIGALIERLTEESAQRIDQESDWLDGLLAHYSVEEIDIAILRALADVLERREDARLDRRLETDP
jgi:hypothetical protein